MADLWRSVTTLWRQIRWAREVYPFGLGGLRMASLVPAPMVLDDRINRAWDERLRRAQNRPLDEFNLPGWPDVA